MPLLRKYVEMPNDLTPEKQRELDRRAMEIILLLPDDMHHVRYVHEKIHEVIDTWVEGHRRANEDAEPDNILYLKVVE